LSLMTWTPEGRSGTTTELAEEAYATFEATLRDNGCVPVQERVFGDLGAAMSVARGRARAVEGSGDVWATPPTFVEGTPLGRSGIAGIHVIAARGRSRLVNDGSSVLGRCVEGPSAEILGLSDIVRCSAAGKHLGPEAETAAVIDSAAQVLADAGFTYRDVTRTWFYLRDILDWYGEFNAVRNAAYRRMGIVGPNGGGGARIPASTGIDGRNARGGWCTLDLLAMRPRAGVPLEIEQLHNRAQNEATEYGSAFARGMAVTFGDSRYIFVSGTASIDDHGATIHVGDFEAQTRQTLDAVTALLESAGATLRDVRQATAFLENPADCREFERVVQGSTLDRSALVTTVADVCRGELLFELDAVAVVPTRAASRR
jgi:enamine deaminase RidA (YjgF/YER057c/UK114 family)